MNAYEYTNYEVCEDCYIAHNYGATEVDGLFYAGESDTPCDREPLNKVRAGVDVTDNTDSETGDGITEFSSRSCDGCGSTLGGSRHRLAVWDRYADLTPAYHGDGGIYGYWTTVGDVFPTDTVRGLHGRQITGVPATILSIKRLDNGRLRVSYRDHGATHHATRTYRPDHPITIITRTAPVRAG